MGSACTTAGGEPALRNPFLLKQSSGSSTCIQVLGEHAAAPLRPQRENRVCSRGAPEEGVGRPGPGSTQPAPPGHSAPGGAPAPVSQARTDASPT